MLGPYQVCLSCLTSLFHSFVPSPAPITYKRKHVWNIFCQNIKTIFTISCLNMLVSDFGVRSVFLPLLVLFKNWLHQNTVKSSTGGENIRMELLFQIIQNQINLPPQILLIIKYFRRVLTSCTARPENTGPGKPPPSTA